MAQAPARHNLPFFVRPRLRELRRERKMRVHVLTQALGRSRNWYWKFERGLVPITVEQLVKLATILEVSRWWELVEVSVNEPEFLAWLAQEHSERVRTQSQTTRTRARQLRGTSAALRRRAAQALGRSAAACARSHAARAKAQGETP